MFKGTRSHPAANGRGERKPDASRDPGTTSRMTDYDTIEEYTEAEIIEAETELRQVERESSWEKLKVE